MDTSWLLFWIPWTFRYFLDLYFPVALLKKKKKKKKRGFGVVNVLLVFIRTYGIDQDFGVYNTKGIALSHGIEC